MNHPKMKMKKGKLVTKQLLVAIDFNSTEKNTIKVIGYGGWVNDEWIFIFGELSL